MFSRDSCRVPAFAVSLVNFSVPEKMIFLLKSLSV